MTTDAQEEAKDALQKTGQPSEAKPGEPSAPPETFTKEQVAEKHSKLDKRISELEKSTQRATATIEAAERRAQAAEQALAEAEKAKDRDAFEAAKDSPDALAIYQARVAVREANEALRKEQAKLEKDKAEHASDIEAAGEYRKSKLADEIAAEFKVSAAKLLSITDGTEAKMRAAAEALPKIEGGGEPPKVPDSGAGSGGGKKLSEMTVEEQTNLSDSDWFRLREEEEKSKKS